MEKIHIQLQLLIVDFMPVRSTNFDWITQSEWGNHADECNTYKMPIRHFTIESRYQKLLGISMKQDILMKQDMWIH